jgi:branched-chain amino acid transport system permease protein
VDWGQILTNMVRDSIGIQAIVYALAAIGLNVHFGYTGLLNFGQAAFLAVAGYGLAAIVVNTDLPFGVGIIVGLLGAVVLALLLGVPTLRLRADYLAIVTIASAEIVRLLARSVSLREYFGGSDGLQGFDRGFYALNPLPDGSYGIGTIKFGEREAFIVIVGWLTVALACLIVFLLMRSPWGRVLKGIREDEDAVRSLGKNVYSYKMQSLVIGGVLGSLGGFVYGLGQASVQPDIFGTETTFFAYTILILGGAARVFGPVVGAVIFWAILSLTDNVLRQAFDKGLRVPGLLDSSFDIGAFRFMLIGAALMLLMIYRPQGIFGDRREIALDAR